MQRQSQKYYNEISSILKTMSEGGEANQKFIDKLTNMMKGKNPPKHMQEIFQENLKRLMSVRDDTSQTTTLKGYLEWMACLPYGVQSKDNLDIASVRELLDKEHYGMEEVKDRILEFVAVGKLRNSVKEKILLLHGPPGVGKTTLAESIARALDRKYDRISLGGESDSSILKGTRRTYIGAYPGKIVTALKKCGTENCVIILDEVDKLGQRGQFSDPQSNLLEILDPAQNKSFIDNYLDYSIDLSNVLFICTANDLSPISAPLLDRMDVITLNSYTGQEKKKILEKYLMPKVIKEAGLDQFDKKTFAFEEGIVEKIINDYCREPGVRSLERQLKKVADKVAFELVSQLEVDEEAKIENVETKQVDKAVLNKYLGNPIFEKEAMYTKSPPGVAVGLAYTSYGGTILFFESKKATFTRNVNAPTLKFTGQLGSVMSESMKVAYTFTRNFLEQRGVDFLEK